ncbi:MAG: nicotinamide riboside transporter PnuC [Gammaproteobacteria bacterium]|jgi:nicotinamide mononucleotide transporter|nr:nicotinamide riboside transporter PnuC [Gammaproteobacteria bacterium]
MEGLLQEAASAIVGVPPWEACAVILAIAYLLLATRENILCWYCALVSTAIYTALFWNVNLLMESALNVYYMAMAIYGWYEWRYGGTDHHGVTIRRLHPNQHVAIIVAISILTVVSGFLLSKNTEAAWPYIDSFTTWASVITTVMVAWKILENWLYWLVIDTISIPLYVDRGLYLTALLFVAYLVIAAGGYWTWRRRYTVQKAVALNA